MITDDLCNQKFDEINQALQKIAQGNLNVKISEICENEHLSSLCLSLNNMVLSLQSNEKSKIDLQNELNYKENRLQSIINNQGEGFGLMNFNEVFTFSNPAACQIFEVEQGMLVGRNLRDFIDDMEWAKILQQTQKRKSSKSSTYELVITLDNGKKKNLIVTATPDYNERNEVMGTIGVFRDITDVKTAEENLRSSEARLKYLLTSSPSVLYTCDIVKNFPATYVSENIVSLFGFTQQEFFDIPNFWTSRIHPEDIHIALAQLPMIFEKNRIKNEYRFLHKNGNYIWVRDEMVLLRNEWNQPSEIIGSCIDITEEKKADFLRKQNDELKEENERIELSEKITQKFVNKLTVINQQLEERETQLKKLNADKDRFISILAHDLKNPFNALLGFTDLLKMNFHKQAPEKSYEEIFYINHTAQTTYKLLLDLLDWARVQQGKMPFNPEKIPVVKLFEHIIEEQKPSAGNKNIRISNVAVTEFELLADVKMLKTVLRNLVSNAIKFTHPNGEIKLIAEKNHESIIITVSDNGVGIDAETIQKLFNISHKCTSPGTMNEEGTGLGLLLCKEFIEKHNGRIWVESILGKGSDFKFSLPL